MFGIVHKRVQSTWWCEHHYGTGFTSLPASVTYSKLVFFRYSIIFLYISWNFRIKIFPWKLSDGLISVSIFLLLSNFFSMKIWRIHLLYHKNKSSQETIQFNKLVPIRLEIFNILNWGLKNLKLAIQSCCDMRMHFNLFKALIHDVIANWRSVLQG